MPNEADIQKAIKDLESDSSLSIAQAAKNNNVAKTTLWNRVKGKTVSRTEINSNLRQNLTNGQEEPLIAEINRLADLGLHFSPQMLHTSVEQLLDRSIGKNWVSDFLKRYPSQLKSQYLSGYDRDRKIADNPDAIAHFYTNVSI